MTPRERKRWTPRPRPLSGGLGTFRPLLPLLLVLAICGYAIVLGAHIAALVDPGGAWVILAWLSLPGAVPVWGAGIVEAHRLGHDPRRRWSPRIEFTRVFRELSRAEHVVGWGVVVAGVTTALLASTPGPGPGPGPGGFTAVPLVFYGFGGMLLYAAWRTPPDKS